MKTTPFLGKLSSFGEAYPNIHSVRIETMQYGDVDHEWQRRNVYSGLNPPSNLPCSNRRCKQGGFDFNTVFVLLTSGKQTEYETTVYCNGHEGSPQGKRKGDPCSNSLEVKIQVSYKE